MDLEPSPVAVEDEAVPKGQGRGVEKARKEALSVIKRLRAHLEPASVAAGACHEELLPLTCRAKMEQQKYFEGVHLNAKARIWL